MRLASHHTVVLEAAALAIMVGIAGADAVDREVRRRKRPRQNKPQHGKIEHRLQRLHQVVHERNAVLICAVRYADRRIDALAEPLQDENKRRLENFLENFSAASRRRALSL